MKEKKGKSSIRNKLLKLFFIVLFIILGISSILNNLFLEKYYMYITEKNMRIISQEVKQIINETTKINVSLKDNKEEIQLIEEELEEKLFEIDRTQQVSIQILDRRMRLYLSSYRTDHEHSKVLDSRIHKLLSAENEKNENEQYSKVLEGGYDSDLIVFVEIMNNGEYIVIIKPLQAIGDNIDAMNTFYMMSGIIALIVGLLVTIKFAKEFTKPIIEFSNISQEMANLNFDKKMEYEGNDELAYLAENVNILSCKLEKNIQALKDEIEFQKVVSRNASHELKTPIAIIKGYAEGITYGIAESKEEEEQYLNVIIEECNRMNSLVTNMLKLSKLSSSSLEDRAYELSIFSSMSIKNRIKNVFTTLMEQKGIEFVVNIKEFNVYGNAELINQSVYNFISNAMKYGDSKKIELSIILDSDNINENKENFVLIEVFNTGNTIPEKDLEKIFQIFYIVDEARTREKNGHGLGLAIVKSIADIHNGKVEVENCINKEKVGVKFTLKLPLI